MSKAHLMRWLAAIALFSLLGALLAARIHDANQAVVTNHSLSVIEARTGQIAPDFTLTPLTLRTG